MLLRDFDIIKESGGKQFTAVDKFFVFELTKDDDVYIDDELFVDGYDLDKEAISVEFLKGKADFPKIDAILITRGGLNSNRYIYVD